MTRLEDLPNIWENSSALTRGLSDCSRELREAIRWIPVTDRLPEDGRYEVWLVEGRPDYAERFDRGWWMSARHQQLFTVTHWRELPEGPKP